jgi:hypothetical protein
VKAFQISFQHLKTIAGRRTQVVETMRPIQNIQLPQGCPHDVRREASNVATPAPVVKVFCCAVSEGNDHRQPLNADYSRFADTMQPCVLAF